MKKYLSIRRREVTQEVGVNMIVKDDLLSNLRRYFGLNLYEVRIWTALLSRGVSTAGELSDIGNVPRSRAYDILESLKNKGFVVMKLGKPIKYVAVEPTDVVDRVKKHLDRRAKESIKTLDSLKGSDVLKELDLLFKQGVEFVTAADLSGAIKGRQNLYMHLETMIKKAQKNVSLVTTSKGLLRKVEALKPELERLNKKGVKIKIAAGIDKDSAQILKDLSKVAEIRHADKLNARFCIVDDQELMFMVMHDEEVHPTYDVGLWINTPYFASALGSMFEKTWNDLPAADKVASKL